MSVIRESVFEHSDGGARRAWSHPMAYRWGITLPVMMPNIGCARSSRKACSMDHWATSSSAPIQSVSLPVLSICSRFLSTLRLRIRFAWTYGVGNHKTIFKTIFENRVMKNKLQKFFRDNFCAFKYFLLNPKAREALAPRRSNAPSTVRIRQELAKLSWKNRRGCIN